MRVSVGTTELNRALSRASGVVNKKAINPAAGGVLLEAKIEPDGHRLFISASDYETGLTCPIPCQIETPGSCVLPFELFAKLCGRLPENVVQLSGAARFRVDVNSGTMKASLAGINPDEFPSIAPVEDATWWPVDAKAIALLIDQTKAAICREASQKQEYQGIHFRAEGGVLLAESTDGKRASRATVPVPVAQHRADTILPEKACLALRSIMEDAATDMPGSLFIGERMVAFKRDGLLMVCRPIAGDFPDLTPVIPVEPPLFSIARARLIETVSRLATVGSDDGFLKILLTAKAGVLTASVQNGDTNTATEDLVIEYAGSELAVRVTTKALTEALKSTDSEMVSMWWKQRASDEERLEPLTLRPHNSETVHLLMPFVN